VFFNSKDKPPKRFSQTFFLARDDSGSFYVLNNVFRILFDDISPPQEELSEGITQSKHSELEEIRVEKPVHPTSAKIANHRTEAELSVQNTITTPVITTPITPEVVITTTVPQPQVTQPVTVTLTVSTVTVPPHQEKTSQVVSTPVPVNTVVEEKSAHSEHKTDHAPHIEIQPVTTVTPTPNNEVKPKAPTQPAVKLSFAQVAQAAAEFPETTIQIQSTLLKKPAQPKVLTAPKAAQPKYEESQTTVIVKNIPYSSTPEDLIEAFKSFGTIKKIDLNTGQGWVHYTNADAVIKLLDAHAKNHFIMQGRTLTIERKRIDKNKEKKNLNQEEKEIKINKVNKAKKLIATPYNITTNTFTQTTSHISTYHTYIILNFYYLLYYY